MIIVSLAVTLHFSSSRSITFYCPPETCVLLCYVYWCVSTPVGALQCVRGGIVESGFNCPLRLPRALGRGWISRRRSCVCHVHAPSSTFSHAASGAVETLLTTRPNMFRSTWSSGVLQGQLTGHLLILRTGKEENKETGLGPLLLHLQKSAGRQMLRFLPSRTPGKTLRAHTSVCVQTHLWCVCRLSTQHTDVRKKRFVTRLD